MFKAFENGRIWLFASLLINAVLLGVLIGGALQPKASSRDGERGVWAERGERPDRGRPFREGEDTLSEQSRAAIGQAFRTAIKASREDRSRLREARADLVALIQSPDATAQDLDAGFERVRQIEGDMRARLYSSLSDVIVTLPPEERVKVGQGLPMLLSPRGLEDRPRRDRMPERQMERSGPPEE
jgi:uncharacterized membrane protein